jgi:hypothetical protein
MIFSRHLISVVVTLNSFQGLSCRKDADPESSGQHDDRVRNAKLKNEHYK